MRNIILQRKLSILLPDMEHSIFETNRTALQSICEKYRVLKLFAFGSVTTARFDYDKSDLDLMVELEHMPPIQKGEYLMAIWNELEQLFGRKVDLLTDQPIKNPYFRSEVFSTRQLITI